MKTSAFSALLLTGACLFVTGHALAESGSAGSGSSGMTSQGLASEPAGIGGLRREVMLLRHTREPIARTEVGWTR